MREEPPTNAVPITAEERSRPVFRLLARAFILLARQQQPAEPPLKPFTETGDDQGAGDGSA
jgi:hypothetical protein